MTDQTEQIGMTEAVNQADEKGVLQRQQHRRS